MGKVHRPRHGSLQFWPRKKSKKMYAKVKAWSNIKNISLLGFVGYKAGMTHILIKDNRPNSITKGEQLVLPVTVIECPALKVYGIRFYKQTAYGLILNTEVVNHRLDKDIYKKITKSKKKNYENKLKKIEKK